MRVLAVILAAGRGTRFGDDKVRIDLNGRPVWMWSYSTFLSHPAISEVAIVTTLEHVEAAKSAAPRAYRVVAGGETRKQSVSRAADFAEGFDAILIHDAARPFVSVDVIDRVVSALHTNVAAAAAVPVVDTIKRATDAGVEHLDRSELYAMQTPQGIRTEAFLRAIAESPDTVTDDIQMLASIGVEAVLVEGSDQNFKITTQADFDRANQRKSSAEVRTGIGYDIHSFSDDPSRQLWLGGVLFEGHPALDGHSDADALLHAVTDAIFGAVAMGDIGQHFPNSDAQWRGAPSTMFLSHAAALVANEGWTIVNLDATVIAETPKVMQKAELIRSRIAESVGISPDRVSVKATTNEKLGSIGRSEGIAAFAIATLCRTR